MDKIYELCPHCEYEVELDFRFEVQICPECGQPILPCSICETCLGWPTNCPLRQEQMRLEEQLGFKS